jgi:hypothetical protein
MAPRILPEKPLFRSDAEKLTFEAIVKNLSDQDAIICNLEIYDSQYGEVEIDFVVLLADYGCMVVEVKGGKVTYTGSAWWQSDADGSREIAPVDQAKRNMHSLRNYLRERWSQGNLKTKWMLSFPFSELVKIEAPDISPSQILDQTNLGAAVANMASLLQANQSAQLPANNDWVSAALTHLQPKPLTEADRQHFMTITQKQIKELTHQRRLLLEQIADNQRYFVRGPAGSGKTWLAVEQTRIWSKAGLKVGLLAFNTGLITYLNQKVDEVPEDERPAWIGSFHAFTSTFGIRAELQEKYLDNEKDNIHRLELLEAAKNTSEEFKFDAFVIDEAQDFPDVWLQAIELCLKDPTTGRIALFGDDRQQLYGQYSLNGSYMAHFRIFDNIRNSRQIAELAAKFAETKLIARGPISFEIEYIEADPKHIMEAADDVVSQLTDQELWIPGEIALLTTKTRHPVHSEVINRDRAGYWREFWQADSVFYGTVGGFKGLERPVVVLVLNGFHNAGDYQEFLYAGITRARDKLIVVATKKDYDLLRSYPA